MRVTLKNKPFHFLFWILILGPLGLIIFVSNEDKNEALLAIGKLAFFLLTVVYVTYFFTFPKYYLQKKYLSFFLVSMGLFLTLFFTKLFQRGFESGEVLGDFVVFVISVFIGMFFHSLESWSVSRKKNEKLEKERLLAEIRFLKTQFNAHFFFNILNDIYALAVEKSDDLPVMIEKTSDLLRYALDEDNGGFKELSLELAIIEKYVDIQRIKHGKTASIKLLIDPKLKEQTFWVATRTLLNIIENTFKHSNLGEHPNSFVHIQFAYDPSKGKLILKTKNSMKANRLKRTKSNSLGHQNMEQQLDIYYKNNYQINRKVEEDLYLLDLEINLSQNKSYA